MKSYKGTFLENSLLLAVLDLVRLGDQVCFVGVQSTGQIGDVKYVQDD